MGVLLRCSGCSASTVSALFYRGPGEHACSHCGQPLVLANEDDERRAGGDRRAARPAGHWDDLRSGLDRRDSPSAA